MHTTQIKLKLNNKTAKDILDWLWRQKHSRSVSMQGKIKRLIRAEIEKESKNLSVYTDTKGEGKWQTK